MTTSKHEFRNAGPTQGEKFPPRVVIRSWWGLGKPYEPSEGYERRPWHKVDWLNYTVDIVDGSVTLADAACEVKYTIEVHYQPTFDFAKNWFRMHKDLPASALEGLKAAIKGAARDELSKLSADRILNETDLIATQENLAQATKNILEARGITCAAYCQFERPSVTWPVQDPNTPQPLFSGQQFYAKVKEQNAAFFLEQQRILDKETADKERLADETAQAAEERAAARRAVERGRLIARNADELLQWEIVDGHSESSRQRESRNHQKELDEKRESKIRLMNVESALRAHKVTLQTGDEQYLTCEQQLLIKERDRARAEEEVRLTASEASNDQTVRLIAQKIQAEHQVELERQRELIKILPALLDKLSESVPIEQLRIVQMNGAGASDKALPGSPHFQIAQGIAVVREFLGILDESGT